MLTYFSINVVKLKDIWLTTDLKLKLFCMEEIVYARQVFHIFPSKN